MGLGADGEEMWASVKCIAQVTCGSSDTPLMFVMGLGEVLMVQEVCGRQSSYWDLRDKIMLIFEIVMNDVILFPPDHHEVEPPLNVNCAKEFSVSGA